MIKYINALEYLEIGKKDFVIFIIGANQEETQISFFNYLKKEYNNLNSSYSNLPWKHVIPNLVVCYDELKVINNEYKSWKNYYLETASENGCIVFCLYDDINSSNIFDLGEWKTKHELIGSKVVIGLKEEFKNEYFYSRLESDNSEINICYSLENLAKETIKTCFNI